MTILEHLIHILRAGGISKIAVGVGWKKDLIISHLRTLSDSFEIRFIEVSGWERGPLQTLGTVLEFVDNIPFILCPADYLTTPENIAKMISSHQEKSTSSILTLAIDNSQTGGTRVFIDDEALISLGGPISSAQESYRSSMLLTARNDFASYCTEALELGMTRVIDVMKNMLQRGKRLSYVVVDRDTWSDMDDFAGLFRVNQYILKSMTQQVKGAAIVSDGDILEVGDPVELPSGLCIGSGVRIVGPTFIGSGSVIGKDSEIGPFVSMGANTRISPLSRVRSSVLFHNAQIGQSRHIERVVVVGSRVYEEMH